MMESKTMPAPAKGASDSQATVSEEDASSFETKEGEVIKLKPSHLPLMNQVRAGVQTFGRTPHCFQTEFIQLCKSMYDLMTGDADEENLFRALTTSSTILLKIGLYSLASPLTLSSIVF